MKVCSLDTVCIAFQNIKSTDRYERNVYAFVLVENMVSWANLLNMWFLNWQQCSNCHAAYKIWIYLSFS